MDFSKHNIKEILKYSIQNRFQDMSPTDFEDFIAELFRCLEYSVNRTPYSGDFGADLIISKDEKKIVVQVKRYSLKNKVGVKDINQVIGARDYYKCDDAMIITTSDYTNPALKLMKEVNVEFWNWNDLQIHLSNVYLDGKDIYQFFPDLLDNKKESALLFKIIKIDYEVEDFIIFVEITNRRGNINVELELPIIITIENKQIESIGWYDKYFSNGTIYAGASVEVAFLFRGKQLDYISVGDRFIFNVFDGNKNINFEAIIEQDIIDKYLSENENSSSSESCYGSVARSIILLKSLLKNINLVIHSLKFMNF